MEKHSQHLTMMKVNLVLIAGLLALGANVGAQKYTAMYVFGDSLSDPGNNKYFVNTLAKANFLPYGIDFSTGPTGRFCNGKILVDFIAEIVGLPLLPSYADVIAKGTSILYGVNYASAGAGILRDTGNHFGRVIPLENQVSNMRKTVDELRGQMQENEMTRKYLEKALVFVDIGANDYLNNYLLPNDYPSSHIYNPHQFVDLLIDRYRNNILEIQSLGLRKFLMLEASPIGCMPLRIQNRECNATTNKMVSMFNARLKPLVHELNSNYPDSAFAYAPAYQLFTHLFANAEAYGLKVKDKACCGESETGGTKPLCYPNTIPCENRDEYLFWDAAHPTEAANRLLARLLQSATTLP